jgi:putative MATE family efflux protein
MHTEPPRHWAIFKRLIALSWPITIAFIMRVGYQIVDIFWVGKLGATEVAAVSLAGNTFFIVLAVGQLIGSGAVTLIAQTFGARMLNRANCVIRQALMLSLFVAIFVSTAGFFLSGNIVSLLGGTGVVLTLGTQYLRILFIGFFFQLLSFSINYSFRGAGDMKTPMFLMFTATIINMVLDPLLILGIGFFPKLGVQGAAVATIVGMLTSFVLGTLILIRGKSGLKLELTKSWRLESTVVRTIMSVGTPISISYLLMGFTVMAAFRIIASFSESAIAAMGIGVRILQFSTLPIVSIGISTTTVVGQYLGARDLSRAQKTGAVSMLLCTVIMLFFSVVFYAGAPFLIQIFLDEPRVVQYGTQYMRIAALYLVFIGLTVSMTGVLRGAGHTSPPMIAGVLKLACLLVLAPQFAYALGIGLNGVWWAMFVSYGIETLVIGISYVGGRWRKVGLELLNNVK